MKYLARLLIILCFFLVLPTNNVLASTTIGADITTDGKIGIGTTSPLAKLDVNGTASISGTLTLYGTPTIATTAKQSLTLGDTNTGNIILNAGNVGIGTTNPSYPLSVGGTSAGATQIASYYYGSTGGGAEIRASNGFSLTVPVYSFWYNNGTGFGNPAANTISKIIAGTEVSRLTDSGVNLTGLTSALTSGDFLYTDSQNAGNPSNVGGNPAFLQYSNDSSSAFAMFYKSRSASKGTGIVVQNNDDIGEINFQPEGGSGPVISALINSAVDGSTITASSVPARLMFWTMPTGGSLPLERMRITSDGDVGIGTISAGAKLEVNGGIRLNTSTAKPTCDSTQRGTQWFTQGANGVKDTLEVCAKDATNAYAWRTLY